MTLLLWYSRLWPNPDFETLTLIAVPTYKVDIKYAKIHCCALKKEAQKPTKAGTKEHQELFAFPTAKHRAVL